MGTLCAQLPLCRRAPSDIPRCARQPERAPGPLFRERAGAGIGRLAGPCSRRALGECQRRQRQSPPAPKLRLRCLGAGNRASSPRHNKLYAIMNNITGH